MKKDNLAHTEPIAVRQGEELPGEAALLKSQGADQASLHGSKELRYLNDSFAYSLAPNPKVAERGLKSRVLAKLKNKIRRWLFEDYFAREAEFEAHVVRSLNYLYANRERAQLVLDQELSSQLYGSEKKLRDDLFAELRSLTLKVATLEDFKNEQSKELETLDSVCRGLERILSLSSQDRTPAPNEIATEVANPVASRSTAAEYDFSYVLLENRFRGSDAEITSRLAPYAELFASNKKASDTSPVLEIGAGRGELQKLFAKQSVFSYGCELDTGMLALCASEGLDVREANGIAHLETLEDNSLSGVIAVQVIEHLPMPTLKQLFKSSLNKVAPGGLVVFETINTGSVVALSQNYFRDPTHEHPLHPESVRFAMELEGFKVREIKMLSPFPEAATLQRMPTDVFMTPRWETLVELYNHNVAQLNSLLYGFQDYCIIAEVPK